MRSPSGSWWTARRRALSRRLVTDDDLLTRLEELRPRVSRMLVSDDDLLTRQLVFGDRGRLRVDPTAIVNDALFNLASGRVDVGPHVFFGHRVSVLTGTHDVNQFGLERQTASPDAGRDVTIEEGAWLASNVTVVGPCRIGAHAVVGACSLVLGDVDPYTVVAGVPARVIRVVEAPR